MEQEMKKEQEKKEKEAKEIEKLLKLNPNLFKNFNENHLDLKDGVYDDETPLEEMKYYKIYKENQKKQS